MKPSNALLSPLLASLFLPAACSLPASRPEASPNVPSCPTNASVMDGWNDRAPPRRIFGNTYYVGTCGLTSLLVASPEGHVLIDGATPAAAPHILANIRMLGFRPEDVKYILNSHEHSDHAGGIAQLQRDTGAQVRVRVPAVATLGRGASDRSNPQFLIDERYPPAANVKPVADGESLRVGDVALTAHATPGHAPGGTSWTWASCEGARCLDIAYTDSVSAISDKEYRYSAHPDYVAAFRKGLDTMAALACDVHITPHPLASGLFARMGGKAPLTDAGACKRYAATGHANLDERLRAEKDGTAP